MSGLVLFLVWAESVAGTQAGQSETQNENETKNTVEVGPCKRCFAGFRASFRFSFGQRGAGELAERNEKHNEKRNEKHR